MLFFNNKPIIAHIRLSGVIGNVGRFQQGLSYASHRDIIKKAFSIKKAKAVAISINSPGGSPVQSHLLYSLIRKLADENKIKVITFAEDVAASGGYMLACAGDEIYANASSIVESIGVIYSGFGFQDLIKKAGVERRVHTAGKSKSILHPFPEEKSEHIKKLKDIQEDLHKEFINLVKHSRKEKLKSNDDVLFNGEFWAGGKAKELGLIDGIGNVFQVLEDRFGKDIKVKNFEKQEGWLKKKLSSSMADAASSVLTELETRSFWNRFGL